MGRTSHSRYFDSELVHLAIHPVKEMIGIPSRAFGSVGAVGAVLIEMALSVLFPLLEPLPASVGSQGGSAL